MRGVVTIAGLGLAVAMGCSFDESGTTLEDGGVATIDGGGGEADGAVRPDAGPCDSPLRLVISVNGVTTPQGPGLPFVDVIVGDTVELSATGSCAQSGINSIEWQISPVDATRNTALPNLNAETLTVYPLAIQQYTVALTLRAADGSSNTEQVFAFRSHGFQELGGIAQGGDTRDVSVSDEHLWIAAKAGPYRADLTNLGAGAEDVNGFALGDTIDTELEVVHYDADGDNVWFAHKDARGSLWKLDMSPTLPFVSSVPFTTFLGVTSAEVEDIDSAHPGVDLATKAGVTTSTDNISFSSAFRAGTRFDATARGGGQHWAGSVDLYDVDSDGATVVDVLGNGVGTDDKIRALAIDTDNDELWVASDDKYVVRVDNTTGAIIASYIHSSSDVVDGRMRELAVETSGRSRGDVWVATDKGLARYKRDRNLWILIAGPQGLGMLTNVKAVAIDDAGGRRAVFAGTTKGVVYSRVP
jgi:hypothetical protein